MGKRGPAKGWKQKAATPDSSGPTTKATAAKKSAAVVPLSAADRENPERLSGEDLRTLAHRRGMAKSDIARLSDDKIRTELRYLIARQYDEAA